MATVSSDLSTIGVPADVHHLTDDPLTMQSTTSVRASKTWMPVTSTGMTFGGKGMSVKADATRRPFTPRPAPWQPASRPGENEMLQDGKNAAISRPLA